MTVNKSCMTNVSKKLIFAAYGWLLEKNKNRYSEVNKNVIAFIFSNQSVFLIYN